MDSTGLGFIDPHTHLTDSRISSVEQVLAQASAHGITRFGLACTNLEDFGKQLILAKKYPGQFKTACGLHPWWVHEEFELLGQYEELIAQADWIGETGLDFSAKFSDTSLQQKQLESFCAHLSWANATSKPLVLHIVRAYDVAIQELKKFNGLTGFVHSFSGTYEAAKWFIDHGFLISYSGSAFRQDRLAKTMPIFSKLPLSSILLETDTPDQCIIRTEQSSPSDLVEIARIAVQYREDVQSVDMLLAQSTKNAETYLWK